MIARNAVTVDADEIVLAAADASAESLACLAEKLGPHLQAKPPSTSPYMSVPEAAEYLRCSRQRIDDLLSSRRLTRVKEGRRTLVRREEIEEHLRSASPRARDTRVTPRSETGMESRMGC